MTLRERLLAHFREPNYSPAPESELARRLGLKKPQHAALSHEVKRLLADKKLIRIQGGRLKSSIKGKPAASSRQSAATPDLPRHSVATPGAPTVETRKIFTPTFRRGANATPPPSEATPGARTPASTPTRTDVRTSGQRHPGSPRHSAATPGLPRQTAAAPGARGELTGRIQFRAGGSAFVVLEGPDGGPGDTSQPSVQVFPEDAGVALPGDRVAVRIQAGRRGKRPGERIGSVVRVVERGRDTIVGNLIRTGRHFSVAPDDPRFVYEIQVGDPTKAGIEPAPQAGDKVVVSLHEWNRRADALTGTIIKRLGRTHEPRTELLGIFEKYNLATEFPAEVEAEVASLPDHVQPREAAHRLDYRKKVVFTIDPDDAKDFDDALSYEALPDGDVRVGIHIADVSTYVRSGTALDREAQRRGNSTYLVGVVIPMLPEKLSNGLCSLVEAQDRLCKAVFLTFGRNGRIKDTSYANTVICSRKRLTYKQAYAFLFENDLERIRALPLPPKHQTGSTGRALRDLTDTELTDLQTWVRALWQLASRLRKDRMAHGSLDLDMPETKIFVDVDGYADRLERIEHDESHQLIEEFMLAANEAVARLTRTQSLPSLYRVHDEPDAEKLSEYRQLLGTFGIHTGDLTRREEIVKLLVTLRTHPQGYTLRTQLLRSLKKACYRAKPDGHFGLHKKDYTHFTSPIRRYSDLVVHRVLGHYLEKHGGAPAPADPASSYNLARIEALGEHLSLTEINSTEAERDSVKVKLLEFFERELGKKERTPFAAIITDVRPHGLFIELVESMTFGFVPANVLPDDSYALNGAGTTLVGRRHKTQFALNGRLDVVVERVDRFKRIIDFRPA